MMMSKISGDDCTVDVRNGGIADAAASSIPLTRIRTMSEASALDSKFSRLSCELKSVSCEV